MFEILTSSSAAREIYATFVFTHGSFVLGMITIFPACLIPQLKQEGMVLDTLTESILGSAAFFMGCIGVPFSTIFVGKAGRKRILQILLLWYAVGMSIVATSPNIFVLCFGLFMTAAILCLIQSIIITYISETCRKKNRGVFISGSFVTVASGAASIYLLNSFLNWRIIAIVSAAIAISALLQSLLIPETKYWHLLKGNRELAAASLLWFQPNLSTTEVERKLNSILQSINDDPNAKAGRLLELIKNLRYQKYRQPVLLALVVTFFRSGNGRIIFAVYITDIFELLEVPYNPVRLCTIFGAVELVGSIAVLLLIYKYNRKNVIYIASAILIVCLAVIIAYKFLINENIEIVPIWLVVICVYAYSLLSMSALNSSLFTILSEIQYAYYRAEMNSFNAGTTYLLLSVYTFLFPYAKQILAVEYALIFFAVNVILTAVTIFVFFPETSKLEFFENTKKKCNKECATGEV